MANHSCPSGTLAQEVSCTQSCQPCGPALLYRGYYCVNGSPQSCRPGKYCRYAVGSIPTLCPFGHFCPDGVDEPIRCEWWQPCNRTGAKLRNHSIAYIVYTTIGVALTLAAAFIFRKLLKSRALDTASRAESRHVEARRVFSDLAARIILSDALPGKKCAREPPAQGLTANLRHQCGTTVQCLGLSMRLKSTKEEILHNINATFLPGSITAILGASGSGKTSFVNALTNRETTFTEVSGFVKWNGMVPTRDMHTGFVPQDDIMHDDLTVYENILFQAQLRLPTSISWPQQQMIIEDALTILGLQRVRNVIVGSPDRRGISGGQKKRVSIAMELVSYPRVIILDEPTSGLDSSSSLVIGKCLQGLQALGLTVISVIHQPRTAVFKCFTHALFFSNGRVVFQGERTDVKGYFLDAGFDMGDEENVADWVIDITAGHYQTRIFPEIDLADRWAAQLTSTRSGVAKETKCTETTSMVMELQRLQELLMLPADTPICVETLHRLISTEVSFTLAHLSVGDIHDWLCRCVSKGQPLTTTMLAGLLRGDNDCRSSFNSHTLHSATATYCGAKANHVGGLQRCKHWPLFRSLKLLITRNLLKFDLASFMFQVLVCIIAGLIVGPSANGKKVYSLMPPKNQVPILVLSICIPSCCLYVFGDDRLVLRREVESGLSVSSYWLAKNIVNLIDLALLTLSYYSMVFLFSQPDYEFAPGFAVYLLVAWYCSGVTYFFSVSFEPSAARLGACLLPAFLILMFGGTNTTWANMPASNRFLALFGPGFYSIESMTAIQILCLPEYIHSSPKVAIMLKMFHFSLDSVSSNNCRMVLLGLGWRFVSLFSLYVNSGQYKTERCTRMTNNLCSRLNKPKGPIEKSALDIELLSDC